MKHQLIILGVLTLLLSIELSGCQESQTVNKPPVTGDIDKIELLYYSIETYGINNVSSQAIKLGDGFIHNNTYNHTAYLIKGTIKNIDHHVLFNTSITINFYDKHNLYLTNTTYFIPVIRRNYTRDFEVYYTNEQPFFSNITQLIFDFTTR